MTKALDASSYVYEGIWTNWSRGKVLGITLTLSPKNASILSPAIAILISIAGSQLWTLFQFALHQSRATSEAQDGLYHQQQVTLRNASTDLNTLWRLIRIAFAWRHQKQIRSFKKSAFLIIWTLVHLNVVIFIGLFASTLLLTGNEVLSRSPFCGTLSTTYYSQLDTSSIPTSLDVEYLANYHARYQQTKQYLGFCTASSSAESCKTFPRDQLSWNSTTVNGLCPFDSPVCAPDVSGAISFDTGYISSHADLGLNAPSSQRLAYRRVNTCAPLNDAKFVGDWKDMPTSSGSSKQQVVNAYYGPNRGNIAAEPNATYSYSDYSKDMLIGQYRNFDPYQLFTVFAGAGDLADADFEPVPGIQRDDADVILVFLSFTDVYESPVADPWFSAQLEQSKAMTDDTNGTFYGRERPLTTLGCTEQHQICAEPVDSETAKRCTPLTGSYLLDPGTDAGSKTVALLDLTALQLVTYTRILQAASDSSVYGVIRGLVATDPPLLARNLIMDDVGLALPNNQWQLEAAYWQNLSMANLQRSVVEYSTGQFAAETSYINVTGSAETRQLCQNQVIRDTAYQSFNFFALVVILVLALAIIVAGLTTEDCISLLRQRKLRYNDSKQDMWILNSDLEMLRLLCEGNGGAVWSRSPSGIPLAAPGHKLRLSELKPSSLHSGVSTPTKGYGVRHQRDGSDQSTDGRGQMEKLIPPFQGVELRAAHNPRYAQPNSSEASEGTYENEFTNEIYPTRNPTYTEDDAIYPPVGWGILPTHSWPLKPSI